MPDKRSTLIPKYRLHKPSGLAVVRLNGRDVYLGQHGTEESRQRYEQIIAEWLSNHRLLAERRELLDSPCALSVSELVVAYLEHAESYYVKNGHPTGEFENIKDAVRQLFRLYGERTRKPPLNTSRRRALPIHERFSSVTPAQSASLRLVRRHEPNAVTRTERGAIFQYAGQLDRHDIAARHQAKDVGELILPELHRQIIDAVRMLIGIARASAALRRALERMIQILDLGMLIQWHNERPIRVAANPQSQARRHCRIGREV